VVVISALAAGGGSARAEDAEKARQLFTQGSKYYDVGQFDRAIEVWQQGYDQKPDPSFLYNIAQAYRQKEDPPKAIFFYKSYLRNSPKVQNRAEVEQKIAALQKQIDSGTKPAATPPGPPLPPAGTNPAPPTVTPPPPPPPSVVVDAPPGPLPTQPPPPGTLADGTPAVVAAVPATPSAPSDHLFDVSAAIGSAFWSSGVQGTADPSFAFTLGGGYTFGSPESRLRFRLGALFGYTFLSEASSRETFLSFVVDPTLELRLTSSARWFLSGDLGLGVLAITGLKPSSALLVQSGQVLMINGAQGMQLTRLGLALQYRITPELAVFLWPAVAGSPKKEHFYAGITRFETLFGIAYRF
jgi:hypothetical protein